MTETKTRAGSIFSLLPWLWIAGLAALVVRARIFLGYWPRPSEPDPKLLPFELHHISLWIGFHLLLWLPLLAMAAYMINAIFLKIKIRQRPLWTFMTGWSLVVAMIFAPHTPFNWVAWFLD